MALTHEPFLIYGAGGHGAVAIDAALSCGCRPDAVLDDDERIVNCLGFEVRHPGRGSILPEAFRFLVAIGDNAARVRVFADLTRRGGVPNTVIHARAVLAPHAQAAGGTLICAGAVVNPRARIGFNCIVNTAASVDHDCEIEDHVHLCPGVRLGGGVRVGESALLGLGTVVLPMVRIGRNTVVGAGSVVLRDLPECVIAYGAPARIIRRV